MLKDRPGVDENNDELEHDKTNKAVQATAVGINVFKEQRMYFFYAL